MHTVVWIAWVGTLLLLVALSGLVGLMYLLTSPPLAHARPRVDASPATDGTAVRAQRTEEAHRRRRAAAIGVAVAFAESDRPAYVEPVSPSNWRLLNRSLRMRQRVVRRGAGR